MKPIFLQGSLSGIKGKQLRKKKAQEKLKEIEVTLQSPPAKR